MTAHGTIEDGFGSIWERCHERCGLQVVRPGKVQCECDGMDDATKALMLASDEDERCAVLDCYEVFVASVFPDLGFGKVQLDLCEQHVKHLLHPAEPSA